MRRLSTLSPHPLPLTPLLLLPPLPPLPPLPLLTPRTHTQIALGGYQSAVATKSGATQDLAQQLLSRGAADTAAYATAVSSLTAADVSGAVAAMVKGAPTLIATGPLSALPKYDSVAKRFAS